MFTNVGTAEIHMGGDGQGAEGYYPTVTPLLVHLTGMDDPAITDTPWLHLNLHIPDRYEFLGSLTNEQAKTIMEEDTTN
jgi:hypothetical protein